MIMKTDDKRTKLRTRQKSLTTASKMSEVLAEEYSDLLATVDSSKWPDQFKEDKKGLDKAEAFKRMVLFSGCCNLEVTSTHGQTTKVVKASENKMPAAFYSLTGHIGRNYTRLPIGTSHLSVLAWIAGSDEKVSRKRSWLPGNLESELSEDEIIFDRVASSHGATIKKGELVELKGFSQGLKTMFKRIFPDPLSGLVNIVSGLFNGLIAIVNFNPLFKIPLIPPVNIFGREYTKNWGMNIAMGGLGNPYRFDKDQIRTQEGQDGHIIFNTERNPKGDLIGIGLEGMAPRTHGPLGGHSNTGGADKFTALEGSKHFVEFKPKSSNFKDYVLSYLDSLTDEEKSSKAATVEKLTKYLEGDKSVGKLSKKDVQELCEKVRLEFRSIDGKTLLVTTFAKELEKRYGVTIPNYYNGQKSYISESNLHRLLSATPDKLPNEIVYFKPTGDLDSFMAQEVIFKGIDEKPLLRDNPQFCLKTCAVIGILYNLANDGDKGAEQALETISSRKDVDMLTIDSLGDLKNPLINKVLRVVNIRTTLTSKEKLDKAVDSLRESTSSPAESASLTFTERSHTHDHDASLSR